MNPDGTCEYVDEIFQQQMLYGHARYDIDTIKFSPSFIEHGFTFKINRPKYMPRWFFRWVYMKTGWRCKIEKYLASVENAVRDEMRSRGTSPVVDVLGDIKKLNDMRNG